MFTIINGIPEDILGVVISGKTTEQDYDQFNPLLEKHKTIHGNIKLFMEIDDLDYTAKAVWEELKADLHYWSDVKYVAVVTDKKFLEKSIESFGMVLPGMKIKGFELTERQNALDWLKEQET